MREDFRETDRFWDDLCDPARRPFAVELDPPAGPDVRAFLERAGELREGGAELITLADCPFAKVRMDSSLAACLLRRELGADVMPHLTARDRNRNATQALLMGLSAEGIGKVLLVTGDPIPREERGRVKGVFESGSRGLIRFVHGLGEESVAKPFRIFAALNVNARSFPIQLDLARKKEESGAVGFLTQPVLTAEALENLRLARRELKGKLLGGILPVVSHRNALFLSRQAAGIRVGEELIARYEGADRARGEELALEISADIAGKMAELVDGYYLMTPFNRTGLMVRLMERIRENT